MRKVFAAVRQKIADVRPPRKEGEREKSKKYTTYEQYRARVGSGADAQDHAPKIDYAARVERFKDFLANPKGFKLSELQKLAADGVPDLPGMRSVVWKVLLNYLPCDNDLWPAELERKRGEYEVFCEDVLLDPSKQTRSEAASGGADQNGTLAATDVTHADHPLSMNNDSVWNEFFKDSEILEQIDRDVKRTHPDLQFFSAGTDVTEQRQEQMKRALLVFAKLNPGIHYVQGMNELFAPLYYIFAQDPDAEMAKHAEADAFFCFVELISEFRDLFCKQVDSTSIGIKSILGRLSRTLAHNDPDLHNHLENVTKVNAQFYAFRWITLLFTQEFNFHDILRLWDSLLSDPASRLGYVLRLCTAMLMCVRAELTAGDFSANLKLLQHYPLVDVCAILRAADSIALQ